MVRCVSNSLANLSSAALAFRALCFFSNSMSAINCSKFSCCILAARAALALAIKLPRCFLNKPFTSCVRVSVFKRSASILACSSICFLTSSCCFSRSRILCFCSASIFNFSSSAAFAFACNASFIATNFCLSFALSFCVRTFSRMPAPCFFINLRTSAMRDAFALFARASCFKCENKEPLMR